MDKEYSHNYNNPYRLLAATISVRFTPTEIKRIMNDSSYIKKLVLAEVRDNIDLPGKFCDCVTTELVTDSKKVMYRTALNKLGMFFFEQLDIPRLRNEIRKYHEEMDLFLEQ